MCTRVFPALKRPQVHHYRGPSLLQLAVVFSPASSPVGGLHMKTTKFLTAAALATVLALSALAQQTQRVTGTVDKIDGNTLYVKGPDGAPITLKLTDNALVVGVMKAALADIKEGSYIGSGALPQPDGSQKAVEVHIFAESMRGTGDGHRANWDGAPNGTMTNGAVGQTVSGVDGRVLTVKFKDGEKKIVVGPNVPIVKYEIGNKSEIKSGSAISVAAAKKMPDGTFEATRINVENGPPCQGCQPPQ
jgi:hypothetical protein